MANKIFPNSGLPIRRTAELLPNIFQTSANDKFLSGVLDPLVQPGVLDKVVGYIGRRYDKTFNGSDIYVDTDNTLRSRYQLEPGVVYKNKEKIENFYDYLDFKNQIKFFGNTDERDDKITSQPHYTWNPPISWDKFINYREYYWIPSGPPAIQVYGQSAKIVSTYKVVLSGTNNSFIFTPDSFTNNPTITLYRGQTYKFRVNAPGEGFSIRTNYDTGSLLFEQWKTYQAGDLAVYDDKLWRALRDIAANDTSSITMDSQDWEYVEPASSASALEFTRGVTNNGVENGTLTFTVPYDAPNVLFYQGRVTPDCFGRFIIADIEANTYINVDNEIIGKSTYTSSNGVEFSNGMIVEFLGNVSPSRYAADTWLIEGVGTAITLTRFNDLIVPVLTADVPEILFDNEGFDTQPFDDATAFPTYKDYITIARDSRDSNPWSRYNRWFHRSVLETAYKFRGQDFSAEEATRAKRPIIEFSANLQLFNHGSNAKQIVDYIDDYTSDVFSTIEGSTGYSVDGEFLFEGARLLVVADTDSLTNNKIYEVTFITHNGRRQLHLKETADTDSAAGDCVIIRRGTANSGKMFHFNGTAWLTSQAKLDVNQPPLFDAYDSNGVSFGDPVTYPTSTFVGSKLLSYREGSGRIDTELGFSLSYLNINNVGDIQFNWDWDTEEFTYTVNRTLYTKKIATGFYKFNPNETFENGWLEMSGEFLQPLIDSQVVETSTNSVSFNTVNWDNLTAEPVINFYINGVKYSGTWTRTGGTFTFSESISAKTALSLKMITNLEPVAGYYEIPVGLERNPFNDPVRTFTLGQASDHISTALEFNTDFVGLTPGNSNLRDIAGYQSHAKRFLKHSGLTPLAMMLLTDKTHNIIKSIQYAKKSYTDFKNNFLARATEIDYNDSIPDFVDDVINSLTKAKNSQSPFADSDMIGSGAYTSNVYTVEDVGIVTYALSEKFDLTSLSRRAVYIYINGRQLLNFKEYEFNSAFGFVKLLVDLSEGDVIEIREYISTAGNHIPVTPTKLGLYKKYTPMKFIDDTYVEPREVIQGHDGSITAAYGDFRDDLLLELEYRIYNNIKSEYNSNIFDVDQIVGGYYSEQTYTKQQLDSIVSQEFLKWVQNTNINYTLNEYLDSENSFTYTYSQMTDPSRTKNLPGYWRGVYKWFYDTDRPHRCPWEILGFSEEPTWWQDVYGPAPYTSGNLILWEDIANGYIRQGSRAGRYDRYKRPTILSHIPVDGDGNLLSPLDSGLARDFSLINNKGPFVLGDIGPVEYAWRSSSEWPFAVIMAMCLMKPFDFIVDNFDRSKTVLNKLSQPVHFDTELFTTIDDIIHHDVLELSCGLVKYLISYTRSRGLSEDTLWDKIGNLDVALSYRMSGFVDKQQQKFLLDSKNPSATSSSIYVPTENFDIVFNVSAPIASITYSGVILEKTESGWIVTGYDDIHPYFNYYPAMISQRDPLISVGGVSENFLDWTENKNYNNGTLIRYFNDFYRALKTHNSGDSFDRTLWQKLADVPKVGAVEAYRRKTFNTLSVKRLSYGTKFTSIQQVVDFLLGYEQWLINQGFIFDRYDPENQTSQDWTSAAKEFMFWTKHNWEIGSIISLSPAAEKINVTVPVGVADNILDGFYDYQVLKGDGKPLEPRYINVNRGFQNISVETTNTTDGIFYLKLYYVLKEHVTIFDDRTVFNDIIYDKTTGYRQGRIKVQGFRTVDWDGDYTSPGFLFDNVDIKTWQPWTDYKLGDIVAYKSYNWTSLVNQLGAETFDESVWSKLDTTPEKQLISNFDYKIKSFADYFEVSSEGIDQSQRELARHVIGYQQREYLQNLAEDPVSQFQLYQGFIREKGTANSITKIFGKLSRSNTDSIVLNEEWAFLLGRMGGTDQLTEVELQILKNRLELNPQLFLIESGESSSARVDQNYRLTAGDFTISPIPYTVDINPVSVENDPCMTAGYISTGQYEHVIAARSDLTTLDITTVNENDHIWITFDRDTWTVLRVNESSTLYVTEVNRTSDTTVELTLNRPHSLVPEDYVGIREITNLVGFYKIVSVTNQTITLEVDESIEDPSIDYSSTINLTLLTDCRYDSYQSIDERAAALFKNKSRVFVDNNGSGLWEVVEKNKQYSAKVVTDYGTTAPLYAGSKVVYDNKNKHTISSIPGSALVNVYVESSSELILKQIVSPPSGFYNSVLGSFGKSMAISADGTFLIVGSPEASGVTTNYRGEWATDAIYQQDDIVLYQGQLWKAKNPVDVFGDESTILGPNTDDWEVASIIPTLTSGRDSGKYNQGMVSVYEYSNGKYAHVLSFVSPRPADNELFGSEVTIGKDGSNYYLAVSAVGAYANTGRVYLFTYNGTEWINLENPMYKGVYDPTRFYPAGSIVWQAAQDPVSEGVPGNLWQTTVNHIGDGSTITLESEDWLKVSDISTHSSLPTNIAIEDDGSTLEFTTLGLLSDTQMSELVKPYDKFGYSMTMSQDASMLVIGAPYADGQYFANYKGVWRTDVEYSEGDVVRHGALADPTSYQYYMLTDIEGTDSTYRSTGDDPSDNDNWQVVGDSTTFASGKIFVYKRNTLGFYELTQMINAASISTFSDVDSGIVVSTGDQFGFAMDMDALANTLVVSSPKADINYQDQGSVYVLELDADAVEYRVKQRLESFEMYPNEYFGYGISISPDGAKIAVGARNSQNIYPVTLDILTGTTFDNARTTFYEDRGFTGGVYVFDKKDQTFFLTEKLEEEFEYSEGFGSSIDCVGSVVLTGSPYYRVNGLGAYLGIVRLFKKDVDKSSWNLLTQQEPCVDIRKIRSIELYDSINNVKIQDIDYVDAAKGKILNIAEQEIKFKTPYDPAVYTQGTDSVVVDPAINWMEKNVGKLWWNTSTAKWIYAEQGDAAHRQGNWNQLATGASIDVYEWVESALLPSEWAALADTNEGIAEGISGQPLYPNDDVYSYKILYNTITGEETGTLYYYWVKGKAVIPAGMPDRQRSSAEVANLISNPTGTGIAYISLIDSDKFIAYNFQSVISSDIALLNIRYKNNLTELTPIHSEYQLLSENVADSLPAKKLEDKWIDSLVGSDILGNTVPDIKLPAKQKYGISVRPRQSMFVDRLAALKIAVQRINSILVEQPFATTIDFVNLNLVDTAPVEILNLYDTSVDTEIDLQTVGTVRTKRAVLRANLINGELDTVDIIDPGFGYKIAPPVTIEGDGTGAAAEVTIDNQGRMSSVTVTARGRKYNIIYATVRYFSVLVRADSTINGFWSIYAWDDIRKVFFRSQSQAYDTTRYWQYIDWWKEGYGITSRITHSLINIFEEPEYKILLGDLIRVSEYGAGGWAVFEKVSDDGATFLDRFVMVGRENGTIELDDSLYDTTIYGIGFDNTQSFDNTNYDIDNSKELRNILKAVKEDIFIGDYAVEWNRLFFSSMRYVLSEQQYVDWMFKTSFLNATHNVGALEQKVNYKNDNLESYQDYINEVKPFRTTVREYVSRYDNLETLGAAVTDFDSPPTYSVADGKIVPITESRLEAEQYPWRWWLDNHSYSVVSINVYEQGSGYRTPPKVLIEGDGSGATAQAYISNGKVSGIVVLTEGTGYTVAPTVTLVGGNASDDVQALASAVIGNTKARTFDLTVRFDRTAKTGDYQNYQQTQTFVATGSTAVFELNYAPTRNKNDITILKNNQLVLNSDYSITLYYSSRDSYSLLRGKITFVETPAAGDVIEVTYAKAVELLNAVNRIEKYYTPVSGMAGKELNQLMTGIDFGGVQIQGTTFDVTGGWDALPWFTDNWDSVEASSDYYHICDGSTGEITLPYIPADGQIINIYIKRSNETLVTRIDDPNYTDAWDSSVITNPNAQMPSFVGNGENATVVIGQYIETYDGDILIFRPIESDGSVTITDENLLDTKLGGGSLSAIDNIYQTATGTSAEEIAISGGKFIEPDHVPAPEENVPGQVMDSVSIKVFNSSVSGTATLQSKVSYGNGIDTEFSIGQKVLENKSVFVYVDKVKQDFGVDYELDLENYTVNFSTAPAVLSVVEVLSVGLGGLGILDYQEFVADGETNLFLTHANYDYTSAIFVTVNGEQIDTGFRNSTDVVDAVGRTLVEFGFYPSAGDVIKIVCLEAAADVDSSGLAIVKVNTQTVFFEGSTRSFDLDEFVDLSRASARTAMLVEIDGRILKGADTTYAVYNGINNSFVLGTDPIESAGSILPSNVKVFVNNELKQFITDYTFDGPSKTLEIYQSRLAVGDAIKIENDFRSEFTIEGNNLIINDSVDLESLNETDNVRIDITWFSEYPSLDIISDERAGGKVQYQLSRSPVSASYVWVYKNGERLTLDKDYYVSIPRNVVYLNVDSTSNDIIRTITFGNDIFRLPSAYVIHKDMLNVYHYTRFANGNVKLAAALNYYDTVIQVDNATSLADPIPSRNIPGIVWISGERIEYMSKIGNALSQLRRGTYGTPIGETYALGSDVVDVGFKENIPYNEAQDRLDFYSDGSSLLIGPLDFTPTQGLRSSWYRSTIPAEYGACDQVEVFAAGRRLRKDPLDVWVEENGAYSPDADETLEAEFSVDGSSAYIRLTAPLTAGTRITVIRRTGKTWYDRGETTASGGVSLLENTNAVARFIAQRSTTLPE